VDPEIDSIALSAHGYLPTERAKRLTLRVSNMPVIAFADGVVVAPSQVTIKFGSEFGQVLSHALSLSLSHTKT
jgi:hypothetical protein